MNALKYLAVVCLGLLLGLYEQTLRTFLPAPMNLLFPVFPVLIMLAALNRWRYAYVLAACAGAVADAFAPEYAHFALIEYLLILTALQAVAHAVFTNRSLYAALALVSLARILDWIWLKGMRLITAYSDQVGLVQDLLSTAIILAFDLLLTAAFFLFSIFVLRRLDWYRQKIEIYG
jgi:hypothetical protein